MRRFSVETVVEVRELDGPNNDGYWRVLTEREPKPDGGKYEVAGNSYSNGMLLTWSYSTNIVMPQGAQFGLDIIRSAKYFPTEE